jgi:hypothetical protein
MERVIRTPHHCRLGKMRNHLFEQLETFGVEIDRCHHRKPGDVSPGMGRALDQARSNRIKDETHDDGNRGGRTFGHLSADGAVHDHDVNLAADACGAIFRLGNTKLSTRDSSRIGY